MGLDVWFREDVARALRAAQIAGREAQMGLEGMDVHGAEGGQIGPGRETAAYWRGYEAALTTIGAAFGLILPRHLLVTEDIDRHLADTKLTKVNGHRQPRDLGVRGEWE